MNKKKLFLPFFAGIVLFAFASTVLAQMAKDDSSVGYTDGGAAYVEGGAAYQPPTAVDADDDDNDVNQTDPVSGRTTMTYSYHGGVLASIYNHDDNTIQHFSGGNMTSITLSSGEMIYQATYVDGHIVSSVDQYGDTTSYNKFGQKTETTHQYYESYDENGNGIGELMTEVIATYGYNEYGQLAWQMTKVADEGTKNEDGTYSYGEGSWQTMTYNYSGATLESISVTDAEGNLLSVINFDIASNGDKIATTLTYASDGSSYVSKVTVTSAATGGKSDTYYSSEGAVTGTGTYDSHNRLVNTYDMDGNLTKHIVYEGAMRTESISYEYDNGVAVLKNTTYFDQYGNMTHTVQDVKQPGDDDWCRYDPWTQGEMVMIDGHLAMIVDPNDVNGNEFYNFDPRQFGNCEEELDENGQPTGRFIVYIACQDPATTAALVEAAENHQTVNLMWQYYAVDENGQLWLNLASASDQDMGWAVTYHSQHDDWSQVNGASAGDAGNLAQFYIIP